MNTNNRLTKTSMLTTAVIQCAVAGIAGSILAANVLIFNTGRIPAESDSLTYAAWGMLIGILLFLFANIRYATKQKAAYVAAGGDPILLVSLASCSETWANPSKGTMASNCHEH